MVSILLEINYKLLNPTQIKFSLQKFIFPWKPHSTVEDSHQIQRTMVFQLFYVQVIKHLHGKDQGPTAWMSTVLARSQETVGMYTVYGNLSCTGVFFHSHFWKAEGLYAEADADWK